MTGFAERFDAFHDMAVAATGLDDFGDDDYREPMRLLLGDYDRHTRFNATGSAMIDGEIVGRLIGRLLAQQGLKRRPDRADPAIGRPLVIFGMPRTGSTLLHRLIAEDPALQSLPLWLGCAPMPRPPRASWEDNPWFRRIAQGLDQAYALDPAVRSLHPMEADLPDECRFAIDHSFWAPDCTSTAHVPDYAAWVLGCDARFAYRYFRRVLGLVGAGDERRWVLKDVDHVFGLDSLLAVFPDACVVQTHREPLTALASVASLIFRLRSLREIDVDPREHGRWILTTWGAAQAKAETVRRRFPAAQFVDVHNDDIHADPVGTIARIYAHFDIPVTEEARRAWRDRVALAPRAGHGPHAYSAADFGLDAETVWRAIGDYDERYRAVAKDAAGD